MELQTIEDYFTVVIPWSDTPTKWHPTERTGPFSVLTRGAFSDHGKAHRWAIRLCGQPYTVREIRA